MLITTFSSFCRRIISDYFDHQSSYPTFFLISSVTLVVAANWFFKSSRSRVIAAFSLRFFKYAPVHAEIASTKLNMNQNFHAPKMALFEVVSIRSCSASTVLGAISLCQDSAKNIPGSAYLQSRCGRPSGSRALCEGDELGRLGLDRTLQSRM